MKKILIAVFLVVSFSGCAATIKSKNIPPSPEIVANIGECSKGPVINQRFHNKKSGVWFEIQTNAPLDVIKFTSRFVDLEYNFSGCEYFRYLEKLKGYLLLFGYELKVIKVWKPDGCEQLDNSGLI